MIDERVVAAAGIALHAAIVVVVGLRAIWVRRPAGSAFAWLLLVSMLPLAGLLLYLLFGERPIGRKRLRRAQAFYGSVPAVAGPLWALDVADLAPLPPAQRGLSRLALRATGLPLLKGATLELHAGAEEILRAIVGDVDAAHESVDIAFYIWHAGGIADEVAAALESAAARGVRCRVLLDALGSKAFLRTGWPARMRAAGIRLEAALAIGPLGLVFRRADLRLHRKIVVVDERVAYTGSMNLVDPRFFKQEAGVGEWIDAMVRIEGPAVAALRAVFLFDWSLQTGEPFVASSGAAFTARRAVEGGALVQVVPSGPGVDVSANLRILVDAVAIACRRIVLTTPYFVPDPALALALQNAAMRGVAVTIIVPAVNDSTLVTYASRAFFDELLAAGARILQFEGGLLHTKSVTIDDGFALFGTVNLDMRSLHLNFELMLAVYDGGFNAALSELQQGYARDARPLLAAEWQARPVHDRLLEGAASLVAPML
jgi:cardiolipin synthase A/B